MSTGLSSLGIICALGEGQGAVAARLFATTPPTLTPHRLRTTGEPTCVGAVHELLAPLPAAQAVYECRNHRLAQAAFRQIEGEVAALRQRFGPRRIGVVLGSSTAGLDATEEAYAAWKQTGELPARYNYQRQHAMGSVAAVVADLAGLKGPTYTLSTACTSAAKAMISARDLILAGICDAVITGGVDTLCHLTLNGFEALGALSRGLSQPMSANRSGLNIGEGAALFVMTRDQAAINLVGCGESTDAHHMSAPHPEGLGAEACMRAALADAGLAPEQIDYINLHGTATRQNDAMEALAVARVFSNTPCSSTKPLVGHCLGAAGSIEAAFCWLALAAAGEDGAPLPPHHWDGVQDPELPHLNLVAPGSRLARRAGARHFLSSSYAFGGNNCAIILKHHNEGAP